MRKINIPEKYPLALANNVFSVINKKQMYKILFMNSQANNNLYEWRNLKLINKCPKINYLYFNMLH